MRAHKHLFATIVVFFSYFIFGFVDNMKGATLPGLLDETGFGYAGGANIVFSEYFGFVLATLGTGVLADLFGKKSVLFVAGFSLLAGVMSYASASSLAVFLVTFFLVGVGAGSLELSGNDIISDLYGDRKGRYLNLLACSHGVGSTIVPLFVGRMVAAGLTWRDCYRASALLIVVFLALSLFVRLPKRDAAPAGEKRRVDLRAFCRIAFRGPMLCLYLAMFAYVGAEIGVATWLVDFLMKEKALSFDRASTYLAIYFGGIMFGRFAGSFVVDRLGYGRVVLGCGAASIVTLFLGIYGPAAFAILLPITGLFYAMVFPTLTAMAADRTGENQGMILGLLFCAGGVGSMLGPWVIGMINARWSLPLGMSVNVLMGVLVVLGTLGVSRIEKKQLRLPAGGLQ